MRRFLVVLSAICSWLNATPSKAVSLGMIGSIISKEQFEEMFPESNPFYTYEGFVKGAAAAEGFGTTGDHATKVREVAAFLANAAHETGGAREIVEASKNKCPDYCDLTQTGDRAPVPGKSYYGRGWLQLSWNYNYYEASRYIYGDGNILLQDPDILERDPAISTQASLWYWMTQKGPGTMSAHECVVSGAGFGCTIRAINGTLECDGKNAEQVKSRTRYYARFLGILGHGKVKSVGKNTC